MLRKIRYILACIMLLGGLHLTYTFYINRNHVIYFIFSIILIIKALLEFIRYYAHKGINNFLNRLLKKRSLISSGILILSFGMFFILSFYFYKQYINTPLVIEGWKSLFVKAADVIDLSAALIFFFIILVDYILLSGKKYQIEEDFTKCGEQGNNTVFKYLKKLKNEEGYTLYKNLLIDLQEFDFILVGDNGIFNIMVMDYPGKNIKIKISENGIWTKEKNRKAVEIPNPEEQSEKHREVLNRIFEDKYPVLDLLVLSNDSNFIEGSNNTELRMVKLSNLNNMIKNYNGERTLSKEDKAAVKKLLIEN